MNYSPKRVDALIRTGLFMACLAIFSMIFSIATTAQIIKQKEIVRTVTVYKDVAFVSDKQKIELFINELLTRKSAKCFKSLLMKESNMRPAAKNAKSSAKGVGQLLKSTYVNIGLKHSDDALAQTVAALSYIGRKYGAAGPCGAWNHSEKKGWY